MDTMTAKGRLSNNLEGGSNGEIKRKRGRPLAGKKPKEFEIKADVDEDLYNEAKTESENSGASIAFLVTSGIKRELAARKIGLPAMKDIVPRVSLPIVGEIAAGHWRDTEEIHHTSMPVDVTTGAKPGDILLRVKGDSMEPQIQNRDLVILRPGVQYHNGEICAVVKDMDSKATLKKLYHNPGQKIAILQPLNPAHEPMEVEAKRIRVRAVYRGVIRASEVKDITVDTDGEYDYPII